MPWLMACCLAGALTGPIDSLDRASLDRAVTEFGAAFARADTAGLDTLLTDDYVHTNGGTASVLDKARWLAYVGGRRAELESGRLRLDRYETSGMTVQWNPPVAVVLAQVTSEGVRDGRTFTSRVQVTQVWLHRGGRWRRAAFHDSPLPGP